MCFAVRLVQFYTPGARRRVYLLLRCVIIDFDSPLLPHILSQPLCPQRKLGIKRHREPILRTLRPSTLHQRIPQRLTMILHDRTVHTPPPTPIQTCRAIIPKCTSPLESTEPKTPDAAFLSFRNFFRPGATDVEEVFQVWEGVSNIDNFETL